MASVSHQTVKLSTGKHASPHDGACVMELASMLAGDPFSDHPGSVSPVVGALLRAYNDSIDDERRQDLYGYAAKVVGSAAGDQVETARADRLAVWAEHLRTRSRVRSLLPRWLRTISAARRPPLDLLGAYAVRLISVPSDESHAAVLRLVDELLEIGPADPAPTAPLPSPLGSHIGTPD